MSQKLNRREFVSSTAATGAAGMVVASTTTARSDDSPKQRLVVGVMGLSRGRSLAKNFAGLKDVEVKYVCDIDKVRADNCAKLLVDAGAKRPETVADFRRILDDKEVDILVCAAPNHWHGPATIMACNAGKHVYVEKPCSHNPQEGESMIAVARKHNRCVQMGTQRRSGIKQTEAMKKLHGGAIGRPYLARCWYNNLRGPIGKGKPANVPANIDFDLWQGPAPRKAYVDNLVHYKWHWRWHWGNGELGNNGVHSIDLCRWGMQTEFPTRVVSSGGRYVYDDDQETPDTHVVAFEFEGDRQITWEGLSCNRHRLGDFVFYGTEGSMEMDFNGGYRIFDAKDKLVDDSAGLNNGDIEHLQNFVDAIRTDKPLSLNAEIEIGHRSTLLCHLGNIAHRTGYTLNCDPKNGHILDNKKANELWERDYEDGWKPKV